MFKKQLPPGLLTCQGAAVLLISSLLIHSEVRAGSTRAWEEVITLPTYEVAPPDPNPRFYSGRTYQGAKATFYPYPVSDQMIDVKRDHTYKAVYLENEFIEISVLPELGGRIFTALDKGNGYDFFYRQHVIKPALIGMLGAWISGGVEWNIPHHHRASSFMPVDYSIEEEDDGAKTLWVGETELRHRLKWMVGITVRPGRSFVEMTVKVFNRTPAAQSFLFWINPAVHANDQYQVIFPPSTQWTVQHGKPEFASWPIAHQRYGGNDYTSGVDISWWKNHATPVSFFAWNCEEDFFGGYDHGRRAGVIQVSNHHVSPGKKFFEWGNGPEGEMWSEILSDEDGHYLELMAGSYSDNQPDYSWIQPGETKVFKHYWYPIRELGGIKNANTEAAVNLTVTNDLARLVFNTTTEHRRAKTLLTAGSQVLLERTVDIGPNAPCVVEERLNGWSGREPLRASLHTAGGKELISYEVTRHPELPAPKPVVRPGPPKDIKTLEELYLTGLRIEQLYSPSYDPVPYYREALRRDPGDYRANEAFGSLLCRQGRFAEAEPLLRAAETRATENYIRPKNCEASYYLGVALRAQDKRAEAERTFWKSIWDRAWQSPGYLALAELAAGEGRFEAALDLVEQSVAAGSLNTKALELKTALLRRCGRKAEAKQLAKAVLGLDLLNHRATCEDFLLRGSLADRGKELHRLLRGEVSAYLELAVDYANAGLYSEAAEVLRCGITSSAGEDRPNPLMYYHLGFYEHKLGNAASSEEAYKTAATLLSDFCFPFQHEAEAVFLHAMTVNPNDARAPYYLGNLLYDHQPERALELWERAVQLDADFAPAQRNLGFALSQARNDLPAAIAAMERATALKPDDSRMLCELDVLYEAAGLPVAQRVSKLDAHLEAVAKRDDTTTRRLSLLLVSGRAGEALGILTSRQFHNWEGSSALHDVHVDACLELGRRQLLAGKPEEALACFNKAAEYPVNQQVGKSRRENRLPEIAFHQGLALTRLNRSQDALAAFREAAGAQRGSTELQFYRVLSMRRAGQNDAAQELAEKIASQAVAELERAREEVDYFAKFGERRAERLRKADRSCAAALGCLAAGREAEANSFLKQTLELHPGHLAARTWTDAQVREEFF